MRNRRAFVVLMANQSNPFAYRDLWLHTIYVATTGNDTTGNGTQLTPYATPTKALSVAVAGDGILMADGTYTAGGAGYWNISKNVVNWIVIEPELGQSGNVTLTGSASNYMLLVQAESHYLKFRYLNFVCQASATQTFRATAKLDHFAFESCVFTPYNSEANYGFYCGVGSTNVSFTSCTFNKPATATSHKAIYIIEAGACSYSFINCMIQSSNAAGMGLYFQAGSVAGLLSVVGCTFSEATGALHCNGGTITVSDCTFGNYGGNSVVTFGMDTGAANTTTATITNCTINQNTGRLGHALIYGGGCLNGVADNITIPACYDYGIVVKQNTGVEIKNCNVAAPLSALYYKGATSPNAHDNILTSASLATFQLAINPGGSQCSNWIFANNIVNVTETSKALLIGNNTHDLGGGVCDYNTYKNNSGLGAVRNDVAVADLTELQAAWADYDVTTNDSHSTVV